MQHMFPKTPPETTGGSNYFLPNSHSHNTQQHPQSHSEAFVRMTRDSCCSAIPPQATFGGLMLPGGSLPRRCPTHQHRNALRRNCLSAFFFSSSIPKFFFHLGLTQQHLNSYNLQQGYEKHYKCFSFESATFKVNCVLIYTSPLQTI